MLIETIAVNDSMIVNNNISFEDWLGDEEFENNNKIKISDNSKAYIDNLIKKTKDKKIEIDYPDLKIKYLNKDNNSQKKIGF